MNRKQRIIIVGILCLLIIADLVLKIIFNLDYKGLMINLLSEFVGVIML